MSEPEQSSAASADKAMQGAKTHARRTRGPDRGVEAGVWTERMLSALESGVVVAEHAFGMTAANGSV